MDIEKLKLLLGIAGGDKDFALQFCLDNTTEAILNYCNLEELPAGLENTAYRMAMDLYRGENFGSINPDGGLIASQSEGDTSVSFRVNDNYVQSVVKDHRAQLNRYRCLSWI
ncbi:MAG: phage head-tail connector protein [Acetobacterium woodii]|nr:phage head-tail connector protein [Acetobacterium woodii]